MLHWVAHYEDGAKLVQKLNENDAYSRLDRQKLVIFDVLIDGNLLVRFDLRDRKKAEGFVWRIRTRLDTAGDEERYHLVGYPGAFMAVFENGVILHFGDWNDVFYPIELHPWEVNVRRS